MQNTRFKGLYNRLKRKLLSNLLLARFLLIACILGFVSLFIFYFTYNYKFQLPPILQPFLAHDHDRTNFLILGMRGESLDGPDMTDTMIFLSINHSNGQSALISLPRDLWSEVLNAKINSAYHAGFVKEATEGGILMVKAVVSEITGQPVHYVLGVDFSLFVKFIDALGGVEIDVPRSFEDYKFPIPGKENDLCGGDPQTLCRYEQLSFKAGKQQMNGTTALKYIRSRQSSNLDEGTDFARSRRQEELISAIKAKLLIQSPRSLVRLLKLVESALVTDITPSNYFPLVKYFFKARHKSIQTYSITEDNLLINPKTSSAYNYQWVLIPKNNDPALIPNFIKQKLP